MTRIVVLLLCVSVALVAATGPSAASTIINTAIYFIQQAIASIEKVLSNPIEAADCADDQFVLLAKAGEKLGALLFQLPILALTTAPVNLPGAIASQVSRIQAGLVSNATCLSISNQEAVAEVQQALSDLQNAIATGNWI
ncbi:hypothetical protein PMAYCL1PPCAC_22327 [Pristionchus mayeri]|uniref:Uncharacterized protein n=1 Tax=Pristionchus mayeri TaxID=1317129 RepID=A0AAN5CY39_9BILA|nr:hypothetical protein PMAYCL1PPCAC_22326 [Pristionchus mayeri]GMR52132.1 hypothetical protein PMAYCL1PPCAC_22327 [Pristionchus mayeri]